MSDKDKTRAKLMGSMRKTKTDAGIEGKNKTEPAASQAAARKPAKPVAKGRGSQGAQPRTIGTDGYQSGARIWPD